MNGKQPLLAAAAIALIAVCAGAAPPAKTWEQAPRIVVVEPAAAVHPAPDRAVPIISLSVKDADLVEVVRSFARIAGVNVVFDPGVQGKVTAELTNVRWDHALAVIVKTQGLAMELDGRILTVAPTHRLIASSASRRATD